MLHATDTHTDTRRDIRRALYQHAASHYKGLSYTASMCQGYMDACAEGLSFTAMPGISTLLHTTDAFTLPTTAIHRLTLYTTSTLNTLYHQYTLPFTLPIHCLTLADTREDSISAPRDHNPTQTRMPTRPSGDNPTQTRMPTRTSGRPLGGGRPYAGVHQNQ